MQIATKITEFDGEELLRFADVIGEMNTTGLRLMRRSDVCAGAEVICITFRYGKRIPTRGKMLWEPGAAAVDGSDGKQHFLCAVSRVEMHLCEKPVRTGADKQRYVHGTGPAGSCGFPISAIPKSGTDRVRADGHGDAVVSIYLVRDGG